MKNSPKRSRRDRKPASVLSAQQLNRITGGEGTPMPALDGDATGNAWVGSPFVSGNAWVGTPF